MKALYLFFSLICLQLVSAQDETQYGYGVFNFENNKILRIFTNDTRVRENPSTTGVILDSLASNTPITIVDKSTLVTKLGERSAHWYKIAYQKDNKKTEGFIWGGNIAMQYLQKNGYDFLFGLQKSGKEYDQQLQMDVVKNYAAVKVFKNTELLDEAIFESGIGESLSYSTFEIDDTKKLKNVDFILKTLVSGEACGIPSYEQQLLFSNTKLVHLPLQINIGDADIFYHTEALIFPNDKGGKPNTIFFVMEEMEKDDKEKEHFKNDKKEFSWDGKVLSQIIYMK